MPSYLLRLAKVSTGSSTMARVCSYRSGDHDEAMNSAYQAIDPTSRSNPSPSRR